MRASLIFVHRLGFVGAVAVLLGFFNTFVDAAIMGGYSPEALAHHSEVIFEGVPVQAEVTHLRGNRWLTKAQFRVERRIKGPVEIGDAITVLDIEGKDDMDLVSAVAKKRSVLVLARVAEHTFRETDGRYMFLYRAWKCPFFYPDEPVKYIYTETGAAIRTYADVLSRMEAQVGKESELIYRSWQGKVVERRVTADWGTDAQKELYAGSAVVIASIEYIDP